MTKTTFLSNWSTARCRQGWTAFASREEAEADQRLFDDGVADGVTVVERRPGYEPGDTWEN